MTRIALVTCAGLADLEDDDRLVIGPLAGLGIEALPAVWDDPAVDWAGFDLAVLRSPWDYVGRRDEFLDWAARVPRLANPAPLVAWNTDKRYLGELADAGVPVVPTTWLYPGGPPWQPPTTGEYVLKPAIGAGSLDTGRYQLADPGQRQLASAHADRLRRAGRTVMLQPYLSAVDEHGETALVYFAGRYSHAIRKGAMLDGPDTGEPGLYKPERIDPREPSAAQRELAGRVLALLPQVPLYARVDLIPGPAGAPLLVELELAEPSLFLGYHPAAPGAFAAALAAQVGAVGESPSR